MVLSGAALALQGKVSQGTGEGTSVNKGNSTGDRPRSCCGRALQCLGGQGDGYDCVEDKEKDVLGKDYKEYHAKQGKTDPFPFPEPPQ